ncbi:MAG: FAD-binding oxidoreductase [Pseudomonadota bacterium]
MGDPLNNSYYRATANEFSTRPSLVGDHKADVCIIGGGFTGLSAALAAAEAGYSVILLEAEGIGFGASGRNGGQLIPGLRWGMGDILSEFGPERSRAIYNVAMDAVGSVNARIANHGIDCDLKTGHLEAAYKPAHYNAMLRELGVLQDNFGHTTCEAVPSAAMARHIDGGNYHGGIYERAGGHFHPLNYAFGLAEAARAAGVQIFEQSGVIALTEGNQIIARTANGSVSAKSAIVGTDSWTGDILPSLASYTVPIMNYNIVTAPLGDLANLLLPSDAAVADSRFVLNYFRLSSDGRMVFGGGEKYTTRPPRDIAAFVRKHMVQVFPTLAGVSIDYVWGGAVSVSMNRLPHFGRQGNIWFAHGFSGHGALMTTLAGELMVEAMRGTMERFDVMAGLPHPRFPGGRRFAKPLATLGLIWYALRDRL